MGMDKINCFFQLQASGAHADTLAVRASNAVAHKFDITHLYGPKCDHIVVGDGAYLVPDDRGLAGKQEFYRYICCTVLYA